ncbi:MAG: lipid A deacylase LpxR family protein, partial [Rhodospirillales bacterium]|nr:lipid A deacylase LpxR family protein [Rhodospirillales bacterium]
ENDMFSGSDRHYTNGIRLSWLSPSGETFKPLAMARDVLESIALDDDPGHENKSVRLGFAVGQDMYTPEDRYSRTLISNDRPYGAWLYGAVSLHTITNPDSWIKTLESVELDIGVVGPAALGEQSQDVIHDARLIDNFEGWDNQIHNEPGIALLYERKWRLHKPQDLWGFGEFDAIPHAGFSLGNVSTHANVGGAVRWGLNLPNNFGPPSLIQGGVPYLSWEQGDITDCSLFLFATAQGKYVARDIFLDGNTFRDSHSVSKRPWVADVSLGISLLAGPVNISYSSALRTREFDGQDHNSRYGSLTISMQNPF